MYTPMYAYTIGCYAPGSREAYVADRQIRGLLPKQRLWAQYAQIPLCINAQSRHQRSTRIGFNVWRQLSSLMSWAWGNRSGFSNHVSNLLCAASICAGSARAFILHASQRGFLSQTLFLPLTRCILYSTRSCSPSVLRPRHWQAPAR